MSTKNFAVILSGGSHCQEDPFYRPFLLQSQFSIAADSGLEVFLRLGLQPDLLIGDMDSLSQQSLEFAQSQNIPMQKFPTDKDKSDTQLALDVAIDKQFSRIYLLAGIGSRLDHTMANLYLLLHAHRRGSSVAICNPWHHIELLTASKPLVLRGCPGDLVSLLPVDDLEGLTLRGLRWEVTDVPLQRGSSLTISNYLTKDTAHLQVKSGVAFVMRVSEEKHLVHSQDGIPDCDDNLS